MFAPVDEHDGIKSGRKETLTSAERKELVERHCSNRVLEMEIEILKCPSAYCARESFLPEG